MFTTLSSADGKRKRRACAILSRPYLQFQPRSKRISGVYRAFIIVPSMDDTTFASIVRAFVVSTTWGTFGAVRTPMSMTTGAMMSRVDDDRVYVVPERSDSSAEVPDDEGRE